MKDPEIRNLLRQTELFKYLNDPHTRIVEELKIPVANARIDLAVINGHFHGYEIKGASDTLKRLPNQLIAYSYIFDYLTVITEEKYSEQILSLVPDWVGVSVCYEQESKSPIEVLRTPKLNYNKNAFFLSKLLWNTEIIEILTDLKIPFKKKLRNWLLCEILSQNVEIELLSNIIREKLKVRENWKAKEYYKLM